MNDMKQTLIDRIATLELQIQSLEYRITKLENNQQPLQVHGGYPIVMTCDCEDDNDKQ